MAYQYDMRLAKLCQTFAFLRSQFGVIKAPDSFASPQGLSPSPLLSPLSSAPSLTALAAEARGGDGGGAD